MRQILILVLILTFLGGLSAHGGDDHFTGRTWELEENSALFQADFIKVKKGIVYLIDAGHQLLEIDITEFSDEDQRYIQTKSDWIKIANTGNEPVYASFSGLGQWLILLGTLAIIFALYKFRKREKLSFGTGAILGVTLVFLGCNSNKVGEVSSAILNSRVPANSFAFVESVFGVFDEVNVHRDEEYIYIESNGIPDHEMMTGITNWQQQVPIPHDYSGDNSWAIPLQPQLAAEPLLTKENFMKGAIAIAVNGIPIFNPLNNRGEDANAIGELDNWGGHCGRADDYHYHLAPTHLQDRVGADKPIAYALDGFPVYGTTDQQLDEYLGRFNTDNSYQYHAIEEYPCLIAGMRGVVKINPRTSAPENEIMPQARTRGIRPALRPIRGASIVDFKILGAQEYSLTYELDGQAQIVNYGWNDEGEYKFEFIGSDGEREVQTYQRK